MELLIRYTVKAGFSVTLALNTNDTLSDTQLRDVLAENILSMLDGSVHNLANSIDTVEINDVCTSSDRLITSSDYLEAT